MKPTTKLTRGLLTQGLAVVTIALISTSQGSATTPAVSFNTASLVQKLKSVPNAELPAQTATLVVQAKGSTRDQEAAFIVGSAVELNPAAAPLIVSSVCRLSPDVAAVVAEAAAKKQPKQIEAIARAASSAAPGQSLKVLAILCKNHSADYEVIASAVAKTTPGMDRSIVAAVGEALPSLKLFITRSVETLAKQKDFTISVPEVFSQVTADVDNTAKVLKTQPDQILTKGIAQAQFSLLPPPPLPQPRKLVAFTPFDNSVRPDPIKYFDSVPVTGGRNYSAPSN